MNFLSEISNNCILIIPNNIKEKILLYINSNEPKLNIKLMNLDEFKHNYYFEYTKKTIFFIMEKYKLNYDFVLDILNNLYYIESVDYDDEKLIFLSKIKNELIQNNLLIFNNIFKDYICEKKIYIYGYDYIENFYKKIFDNLNTTYLNDEKKEYHHNVYEFDNIDDEITFVANKICSLITSGTNLNNVKIINPSEEYIVGIKRIFKQFNIPFNLKNNYLYSTKLANSFFESLDSDITITLNHLKQSFDFESELINSEYNSIVNICNNYSWCDDFKTIKKILIEDFKKTKLNMKVLEQGIEFVNLNDNIFSDNNIVFLLGFNQSNYPKTYKDDDYINDNLKVKFNLENTTLKNKISYDNLINKVKNIKNIYISYKLKTPFNTYYSSQIIEEINLNVIKSNDFNASYSHLNNKLKLSDNLDNYLKYGTIDKNLKLLYSTYPNINYKTYKNQYTKISTQDFNDYMKNNLLLSYSSINDFYKCGFRYYIENILKIQKYDNDFTLLIGNLFHYILSIMYTENFDFEKSFDNYLNKNYEIKSYKENFFINKLKKELIFIINAIKNQDKYTTFDKKLFEETVKINLSKENYNIVFKGIIDKILYKENYNETLISIIDYKTGNPNLNLNNIIYGIDMQLCIYAYLCSKIKKFENPKLIGIYLQKVLNNEINIDKKKDYNSLKLDNLKLQGYSLDKENLLSQFDTTYIDSELIKSLKVGKNGFYAYSKTFNNEMLDKLLQIVSDNINNAVMKILDREFTINPKKIGIKNLIGCEYCKYKDLCFMNEDDVVNLKEYKNLEFLKGDNNEMD